MFLKWNYYSDAYVVRVTCIRDVILYSSQASYAHMLMCVVYISFSPFYFAFPESRQIPLVHGSTRKTGCIYLVTYRLACQVCCRTYKQNLNLCSKISSSAILRFGCLDDERVRAGEYFIPIIII